MSLDRVTAAAPAAGELLQLCAFLAPTIPRGLLPAQSAVVIESLAGWAVGAVVGDAVRYNNTLGVVGRYSLAELTPGEIEVHRLVQAVIRARLDPDHERKIAACAVAVLRATFPNKSEEITSWEICEQLLPQVMAVCEHTERLSVAREEGGWLLDRASNYLLGRGQYREARRLAERSVALTQAAVGPEHLAVTLCRDTLARVLLALGDYPAALAESEQIVQRGEQALGSDHPRVRVWRGNLGGVMRALGDLDGARTQFERALQTSEQALGADHSSIGVWRNNLGLVLKDLGDHVGARIELERALQISEQALGADHPTIGIRRNNLGAVLEGLGDHVGARIQFERAVQISEQALGPDHPTIGIRRANLGRVLSKLGDLVGARTEIERALQISEQTLGPDHEQSKKVRVYLDQLPPSQ